MKLRTTTRRLAQSLLSSNYVVFDVETSGLERDATLCGIGLYIPSVDECWYLNAGHATHDPQHPLINRDILRQTLQPFFGDPQRVAIAHNVPFDANHLLRIGLDIRCRLVDTITRTHRTDEHLRARNTDAPTLHTHVGGDEIGYGLKVLTAIFLGYHPPTILGATDGQNVLFASIASTARYCASDCLNTWRLFLRSRDKILEDPRLRQLVAHIDDPAEQVVLRMMHAGIGVDLVEIERQEATYLETIQRCKQLLSVPHGLSIPTRNEEIFEAYKVANSQQQQILSVALAMREMEQRCSAFLTPYRQHGRSGRVHPTRFASTTTTTRYSASPQVHSLPSKSDKRDIWRDSLPASVDVQFPTRDIVVARPGSQLVSIDLAAAEPRYIAQLCQHLLTHQDTELRVTRSQLQRMREAKYGQLLARMRATQRKDPLWAPEEIHWPKYQHDPLWLAFQAGEDPYAALLRAMLPDEYAAAPDKTTWLKANRHIGKRAFLAIGYGSSANSLAPQLGWTVASTQKALEKLFATYATIAPAKEITHREIMHLGEVRTLWGRPIRVNGYYQLCRPDPLLVRFVRRRPVYQEYNAEIIPLGTTKQAVQCLVLRCDTVRDERHQRTILEANADGSLKMAHHSDPFVRADHFNKIPFRNISYSTIRWVQESNGLIRYLPEQAVALRQAFNWKIQGTGADHLRWLMNSIDHDVCQLPRFAECKLILSMHDSVVYEVPAKQVAAFCRAIHPIMTRRPPWGTLDVAYEVEVGERFGSLQARALSKVDNIMITYARAWRAIRGRAYAYSDLTTPIDI